MSTTAQQAQQQRYPCPVCGNTFTRPQHVVRHLRSHTGERPYKCRECGDAFARSDLLSRHVNKCHPHMAAAVPPPPRGQPKRRACENCAHTGSKCDSNSPCSACVEQHVVCSRLPKALAHQHPSVANHHPHSHHPGAVSDSSDYSLSSSSAGSYHRRNISDQSDWSTDSSRSRNSRLSSTANGGPNAYGNTVSQYADGMSLEGLGGLGLPNGGRGLGTTLPSALPWSTPSSLGGPGGNGSDQPTLTPSQVRAVYGGTLPTGYTHPSQYASSDLNTTPSALNNHNGGPLINLPNPDPTAATTGANPLDSYNTFASLLNPPPGWAAHQGSSASNGSGASSSMKQSSSYPSSSPSAIQYPGQQHYEVPSQGKSYGYASNNWPSTGANGNGGAGGQNGSILPNPAWGKTYNMNGSDQSNAMYAGQYGDNGRRASTGGFVGSNTQQQNQSNDNNSYGGSGVGGGYDMMNDFAPQSVRSIYAQALAQQQQSQSQPPPQSSQIQNETPSSSNSQEYGRSTGRPSLPGLKSFNFNTSQPQLNYPLSAVSDVSSSHQNHSQGGPLSGVTAPTQATSAPGLAYLFGRNNDRRGSVSSSGGLSEHPSLSGGPGSSNYDPSSPGGFMHDGRPSTSGSNASGYGPLQGQFSTMNVVEGDKHQDGAGSGDGHAEQPSYVDGAGSQSQQQSQNPSQHQQASAQGGAGSTPAADTPNRLRQIWSSWLATPYSSSSEKEAFLGGTGYTPQNEAPLSAVPSHMYGSSGGLPSPGSRHQYAGQVGGGGSGASGGGQNSNQGQGQNQGQGSYSLQKAMSLPSIKSPNSEHRRFGGNNTMQDMMTPRGQSGNHYALNDEGVRRYQEACLARDAVRLAPPPVRSRAGSRTTPDGMHSASNTDGGSTDGDEAGSPSSTGSRRTHSSIGSGGKSGSDGGSVRSVANWVGGQPPAVPAPDTPYAKDNFSHQLGPQPRPSYKRLASQTLEQDDPKSMRTTAYAGNNFGESLVEEGDNNSFYDDTDDHTRTRPVVHRRKRSNSSPSTSSKPTSSNNNYFSSAGSGAFVVPHAQTSAFSTPLSGTPVPPVGSSMGSR